jgi:hypothetical protein
MDREVGEGRKKKGEDTVYKIKCRKYFVYIVYDK